LLDSLLQEINRWMYKLGPMRDERLDGHLETGIGGVM